MYGVFNKNVLFMIRVHPIQYITSANLGLNQQYN